VIVPARYMRHRPLICISISLSTCDDIRERRAA
jgi:hypothetical protein